MEMYHLRGVWAHGVGEGEEFFSGIEFYFYKGYKTMTFISRRAVEPPEREN